MDIEHARRIIFCDFSGPGYGPAAIAALITFILTALLLKYGRRPVAWIALVLIVPIPMLVTLTGTFWKLAVTFSIFAITDQDIKPAELAGSYSEAFNSLRVGMIISAPTYILAAIGLLIQSFGKNKRGFS